MGVCRRDFLLASAAAAILPSGAKAMMAGVPETDENLTACLADIHVAHADPTGRKENEQPVYQNPRFERAVDEVLALRPRPKRAVIFGDLALWYGWTRDYETVRPGLARLRAAGIEVTVTTGNHDHRDTMFREYPSYAKTSPVAGRFVSVVDLGGADLLLLDSLDENPKGEGSRNGVAGVLDTAQQEWLVETAKAAKRPFLVGAHHPLAELKVGDKPLVAALHGVPAFSGFIHGHDHRWYQKWHHVGFGDYVIHRSACLPSTGWWGDIGFALLKTFRDRAVLSLVEDDFYFPNPPEEGQQRPPEWDDILQANRGASCVFRFG